MMPPHFTPGTLAGHWASTDEHVLDLIHTGQLEAFSISPNGAKRRRFRISAAAVAAFEQQHSNRPQPAAKPGRRSRAQRQRIKFYS